jgi:ABC-2 type transport system ATP-binding protein
MHNGRVSMVEASIAMRGISKIYPRFEISGIDLAVPAGRVLGLIGPNGAGKSTLLRIMMGLVRADAGTVAILGREMPRDERWIKARAGFVSEDMALYGGKTLRWHMDLVASVHEGWDEGRAGELLARLQLDPGQRARGMSRGQQVKALLLLALARRAEVLILDEPTAGLDPLVRHELMSFLRASRSERQAIVFSSHHGEDVSALADDVVFLHGGRVAAAAPVASFLAGGRTLEQAFLECVSNATAGRAA